MNEKIIINNFGGINNISFDVNSINVIIGPQASGKSMVVKLLYFFKSFFDQVIKSLEDNEQKREFEKRQHERFYNYFPRDSWPENDFNIRYEFYNSFILIERKNNVSIKILYSDSIKSTLIKLRKVKKEEQDVVVRNLSDNFAAKINTGFINKRNRLYQIIQDYLGPTITYEQLFIPAGRSFFANIQSSIFSFLSDNRSIDPFLVEFGSFYENFKRASYTARYNPKDRDDAEFNPIFADILNGKYLREKGKDFVVHNDQRKVNLSNASSGQQEILPLIVVLNALRNAKFRGGGVTLYIEEPEAHLFPISQRRIVQLLAKIFNLAGMNFQIFVTTHSPYILSSFNNLLEAGKIKKDFPEVSEKLNAIVPNNEIIDPDLFVAYSIVNGEKKDLIDKETQLISQNILDSISNEISIEFGELLDLY